MPWVCTCGQRNIVDGLPCLACDRAPAPVVVAAPVGGSRFRENPSEVVDEHVPAASEPAAGGRRFRFTLPEDEIEDEETPVETPEAEVAPAPSGPSVNNVSVVVPTPVEAVEPETEPVVEPEPVAPVAEVAPEPIVEPEPEPAPVVADPLALLMAADAAFRSVAAPAAKPVLPPFPTTEPVEPQAVDEVEPEFEPVGEVEPEPEIEPIVALADEDLWGWPEDEPGVSAVAPIQDETVEDEPVEDEPVEDEPVEDEPVEDEAPVEGAAGEATAAPVDVVEDEVVDDEVVDDEDVWNWPGGSDRREAERRSDQRRAEEANEGPRAPGQTPRIPMIEEFDNEFDGDPWAGLRGQYADQADRDALTTWTAGAGQREADRQTASDAASQALNEVQAVPVDDHPISNLWADDDDDDEAPVEDEVPAVDEAPAANDFNAAFPTPWGNLNAPEAEAADAVPAVDETVLETPVFDEPIFDEPDLNDHMPPPTAWGDWTAFDDAGTHEPAHPESVLTDAAMPSWPDAPAETTENTATIDSWSELPSSDQLDWGTFDTSSFENEDEPAEAATPGAPIADHEPEPEWAEPEPEWADHDGVEGEWADDDDDDDGWVLDENGEWVEAPTEPAVASTPASTWSDQDWSGRGDEEAPAVTQDSRAAQTATEPAPWWLDGAALGTIGAKAIAGDADEIAFDPNAHYGDDDDEGTNENFGTVPASLSRREADPYASAGTYQPRSALERSADLFDDDADLDSPDEFELEDDDWALVDEAPRNGGRNQGREPARGRNAPKKKQPGAKPNPKRGPANRGPKNGNKKSFQFATLLQGSKVIPVVVGVAAILVLSLLFKEAFARVAAAPNPATTEVATCASDAGATDIKSVGTLESAILGTPAGWQVVPDHQADTGAIDFSKALKSEPIEATALAALDQTRFENGFSRAFSQGSVTASVAVYQFNGASCANDYVQFHSTDAAKQTFDVTSVANVATGQAVTTDSGTNYVVRAAKGNRVEVITWSGDKAPAHAVSGVVSLAASQWSVLTTSNS